MGAWSLKKKLISGFTVIILLVLMGNVYSIYSLQNVNEKTEEITKSWIPGIIISNKVLDSANGYEIILFRHLMASVERKSIHEEALQKLNTDMDEGIAAYRKMIETAVYVSEAEKQADIKGINQVEGNWKRILSGTDKMLAVSRSGDGTQGALILRNEVEPLLEDFIKNDVETLTQLNVEGANQAGEEVANVYNISKWVQVATTVVIVFICVSIAMVLIRGIMAAVTELLRISKEIAAGNLSGRAVPTSNDELGRLAEAYNAVIDNTKALIGNIQKTSEQVAASSEELTASADQSAEVTQQVAQSITQVAHASDKQVSSVDSARKVIENISAGIEQTAAAIAMTADESKKAVDLAQNGNVTIENAVQQMLHIEETVNKSAQVVTKLGQRSQEIGQIVDTIAGIAGQTNLLALNAAIEAARAGEQGRGFAVVAEEVRKLAEQSQEAAKQIGELIGEIQGDTDKAVIAMDEGTKEVQSGTNVVNTAGEAFIGILEMVRVVNGQAIEIAKTMDELAHGTQQIVTAVQDIDGASKNVASESQTVSAATEEQSASMQEIAANSKSLANLAQELQVASSKFSI